MLEAINAALLAVADVLLGWMLYLPRDLALVLLALGTAAVLTLVRLVTTDQDLLGRCKRDIARLKELLREAKKRRDKEAVARHRATMGQIGMVTMKAEVKPLLAALLPVALLAVWAFANLGHVPADGQEPVLVKAYFPTHLIGQRAHIVPQEGLKDAGGWYRVVQRGGPAESAYGVADWTLLADAGVQPTQFGFNLDGQTYRCPASATGRPAAEEAAERARLGPLAWSTIGPASLSVEGRRQLKVGLIAPANYIGRVARLMPEPGLHAAPGWVRRVVEDYDLANGAAVSNGVALWAVRAERRADAYALGVRFGGQRFEKNLIVDGRRYAPPLRYYDADDLLCVETVLPEYKPFGVVPGVPALMLEAWMVGYLLIVLPLALLLKPVLHIH